MLGNAKQFVPPTNKAHSPQINGGGGGGEAGGGGGGKKEKKKKGR